MITKIKQHHDPADIQIICTMKMIPRATAESAAVASQRRDQKVALGTALRRVNHERRAAYRNPGKK